MLKKVWSYPVDFCIIVYLTILHYIESATALSDILLYIYFVSV